MRMQPLPCNTSNASSLHQGVPDLPWKATFILLNEVPLKRTGSFCAVSFVACTWAFSSPGYSTVFDGGIVHMRGSIAAEACSVSTGDRDFIVDMGEFRSNQFEGVGSYASPVAFDITLAECDSSVSKRVAINFLGISDDKDPLVLRAGYGINPASGVGLAIFDSEGNIVPPNVMHLIGDYSSRGERSLHFIARYRATSHQITGGNADAFAWLTLSYL